MGEIPKIADKKLPDGYAASAINCNLETGDLAPIKGVTSIQDLDAGAETIFRLADEWLQWNNKISVVESFVSDSGGRIVFTGDSYPKETNAALAISSSPYPTATRRLGIPAPTAAPTVTNAGGGTGTDRDISYCYTIIGQWSDGTVVESAPSPATDVQTIKDDDSVTINDFVDSTETGVYTTHFRIYRINATDTGAEFQFAADLDKTTTPLEWVDNIADADLGAALKTEGWTSPPDGLMGILATSNGLVFGFVGNTVYVSESFIQYAFPAAYAISVGSEIVGLGYNGAAVLALTKTRPFAIYGDTPESLSVEQIPLDLPCKSARSIVSLPGGVIFSSTSGLQMIDSAASATNLTIETFTRKQWEDLGPEKIFGFFYNNTYTSFWSGTKQGIEFKPGLREIRRFVLEEKVYGGQYVSTVSVNTYEVITSDSYNFLTAEGYQLVVTGATYSLTYDTLYLIQENGSIREIAAWNSGDYLDYEYQSREFYYPSHQVLTAGRIVGDFSEGSVTLVLYIDGVARFTKTVSSESIFRIPPLRGNTFSVNLSGKATVESVQLGASVLEVTQ